MRWAEMVAVALAVATVGSGAVSDSLKRMARSSAGPFVVLWGAVTLGLAMVYLYLTYRVLAVWP